MTPVFIFDYGNVLSVVDTGIFGRKVLRYAGCSFEELRERHGRTRELVIAYESGSMDTDAFIPAFMEKLGLRMSREEFIAAWSDFFIPIPYTRTLVRAVKPYCTVALLSNTNPLHYEHVIRPTYVFPLFDAVTLSYEAGAMKPAPVIYHDMLEKLKVRTGDCLFIDDLRENVEAARAVGMQALLFTTPEEFHEKLLALPLDPVLNRALKDIRTHT